MSKGSKCTTWSGKKNERKSKAAFATYDEARAAIPEKDLWMRPYECLTHKWHIGHVMPPQLRVK